MSETTAEDETSEITAEALAARMRDGGDGPLVVDVRAHDEYEAWHIPGSRNVDVYEELVDDPDAARDALADLPEADEVVAVCVAGVVSQRATEHLQELGYDAVSLRDGMNGWSRLHRAAPVETDLDGTLVQVARPGKGCLSHVLVSGGEAAVFDPSSYLAEYDSLLAEHGADLVAVFDTHAHADHVSGGRALADRHDVAYHLHPADAVAIDAAPIADGQTWTVGTVEVEAIHTPGHSPGGVTFDVGGAALVTGDTLFHRSVGRVELGVEAGLEDTDVADNAATLYDSLQRLLERPGDPLVLPAHDPGSPDPPVALALSAVRERNPDLRRDRDAFVERLSADVQDHPPNFERVKRVNVGVEEVPEDDLSSLEVGPNRCAAE